MNKYTLKHREAQKRYKASLAGKLTEKKYRLTEKFKQAHKRYISKQQEHNKIYKLVFEATKTGILLKKPCEICGKQFAMAHHDDYNKPYEVKWFCHVHHAEYHKKRR